VPHSEPGISASTKNANHQGKVSGNNDDDCVVCNFINLLHELQIIFLKVVWDSAEVLCVYHNIAPNIAQNLITLFDNDNTIPFIARYRRGLTNNMEAEQLRVVRDAYEELKYFYELNNVPFFTLNKFKF
jgi:Tex-like protein N-terminal domain